VGLLVGAILEMTLQNPSHILVEMNLLDANKIKHDESEVIVRFQSVDLVPYLES
jgi:hypothetical protein